jgi:hypothetical protein
MATWKASIKAFVKRKPKDRLFPDPEFVLCDITVEENSVIRLSKVIKEQAEVLIDGFQSLKIISIDRIDKKTGKDYSAYCNLDEEYAPYATPSFRYILDSDQMVETAKIQASIYGKLQLKEEDEDTYTSSGYWPKMLYHLDENHAYITGNWERINSHEKALKIVENLSNFYLKLSPIEIEILNIDKEKVTFEEYVVLKKYYEDDYENYNVFKDKNLGFISPIISESQIEVLSSFLSKREDTSGRILQTFLQWIADQQNSERILKVIDQLETDSINKINSILGLAELKKLISIWDLNKFNTDEGYWQNLFEAHSILLSQIFAYPVTVIGGKIYVGGKNIHNKNGNITDFLLANKISDNVMIVEIKTPSTKLMGAKYRGAYNVSTELSGSIIQVSNYKDSLTKEFMHLTQQIEEIHAYNPDCFLIIGNITNEGLDSVSRKSFELFRKGLRDIQIITFDELFAKATSLVEFLEGTANFNMPNSALHSIAD